MPGAANLKELKTIEAIRHNILSIGRFIKINISKVKNNWLDFVLAGLFLVSFGYGWWLQLKTRPLIELSRMSNNKAIMVDIGGAVKSPGVYYLKQGQRVIDAINAAGGLDDRADMYWLDAILNKAKFLVDGEKIYIPFQTKTSRWLRPKISLNYATLAQLDLLPGIGLKTAQKILDNRPYAKLDEIVYKGIINQSTWLKIKDMITL